MRRIRACATALWILSAFAGASRADLFLVRYVLAGGGAASYSSGFTMQSTLGQAAVGHAGSAAWTAEIGYWLPLSRNSSDIRQSGPFGVDRFELGPCIPNPAGAKAALRFGVPVPTRVTIRLFDIAGREVRILTDEDYPAGRHQVDLESQGLPSGVYLCSMTTIGFRGAYRLILAR